MKSNAVLAEVLARTDIWRGDRLASSALPALASGHAALDAELPGGGWPRSALTELLVDGVGFGELQLLMPVLRDLGREERWSLLAGMPYPLHAPALVAAGIDLSRLVVVSAATERDALWATEQALASGAPGIVLCWAMAADARVVRRLQVAAAEGAAAAFLFRPLRAADSASPAPLRLALAAGPAGCLDVAILKRRGPPLAAPLHLDLRRSLRRHGNHESALAGARPAPAAAGNTLLPA